MFGNIGKYALSSLTAENGKIIVEINDRKAVINDVNAEWAKKQENETGEEISFFRKTGEKMFKRKMQYMSIYVC